MDTKKRNYIQKLLSFMGKSIVSKKDGKVSSTRLSAYFFLSSIITFTVIFIGIESTNAFMLWKTGMPYVIPREHIVIFGMLLAHHLTLLGINKNAETKVEQAVQERLKSINDSTKTPPEEEEEMI